MTRSHPETGLITENNVRRTNTGEEGLRETKNNAFGLAEHCSETVRQNVNSSQQRLNLTRCVKNKVLCIKTPIF